jgi:RimJ/RimL family protein N-acetyltransferase
MEIKTARLTLREFVDDDWRAVLAYQSDPRYLRLYEWAQRTEEDVRAFVGMFIGWQFEIPRTRFQLAIILRGALIGNCGVRVKNPDAREAEIGYELDPNFWGNGYATEAARAILDFGFREFDLRRINAWCLAENGASARVLERLGLHCEERFPAREWFKNRWWDSARYAIAREEWKHENRTA